MGEVDGDEFDILGRDAFKRPRELRFEDPAGDAPLGGEIDEFDRRFGERRARKRSKQAQDEEIALGGFTQPADLSMTDW